jgi:hypothetical protein
MKESTIQTKIIKYVDSLPKSWTVKIINCNKNGTPDVLCCIEGRFVAFEVKTSTGIVSELQRYRISEIRSAEGEAYIVRSLEEVKDILRST